MAAELEALKAAVADLQARQEEAEERAALDEEDLDYQQEKFQIYGFMDMGLQKTWVKDGTILAAVLDTNAWTFATGNIDLYFDFNPHPDWRALAEIRFTGAPLGNIATYGGLTGEPFSRVTTEQYDPHGTAINAPMWGGYTVIERAWIEWGRYQQLNIRVGDFFTPFGIWNVDHGSPTLIAMAMPQFIQQKFMPLRQTGVQALGSFFAGPWEIAYRAWLTNGRTEQSILDFDNSKAFGGRAFVRKDSGDVHMTFGGSYHHGNVTNKVVDVVAVVPTVAFDSYSTIAYTEDIFGADVSLDIFDTRIRAEFTAQLRRFEDGKRPQNTIISGVPGSYQPDGWRQSGYIIVAQQLPWWGLEPYFYGEVLRQDWDLAGDGLATLSGGLNIRFNPTVMLKLQGTRALFFKWAQPDDFPGNPSDQNASSFISRLVMAF